MTLTKTVNRGVLLAVSMILVFLVFLDSSVTNLVSSQVLFEQRLTSSQLQLMQSSYVLAIASTLIAGGMLVKAFGVEFIGATGSLLFGASSFGLVIYADAWGITGLRLLQGLGAALILPAVLTWLSEHYTGAARKRIFLVWGSLAGVALALGPLLSSLISTQLGWRAVFAINIPVTLVFCFFVFYINRTPSEKTQKQVDLVGLMLSFVGVGSLSVGLELIAESFAATASIPWMFIGVGVITLFGLVLHSLRRGAKGLSSVLQPRRWKDSQYRTALVCALLVTMGEVGILFTVPIYLQNARLWDPLDVAWVLAFIGIGAIATFGLDAILGHRLRPQNWLVIGLGLEIIAGLWFASTVTGGEMWQLQAALFLYGLGLGLTAGQIVDLAFANQPAEDAAETSAMVSTLRQVGAVMGVALIGSTMLIALRVGLATNLEAFGTPPKFASSLAENITRTAGANIFDVRDDLILHGMPKAVADDILRQAREDIGNGARAAISLSSLLLVISLVSISLIATRTRRKGQ